MQVLNAGAEQALSEMQDGLLDLQHLSTELLSVGAARHAAEVRAAEQEQKLQEAAAAASLLRASHEREHSMLETMLATREQELYRMQVQAEADAAALRDALVTRHEQDMQQTEERHAAALRVASQKHDRLAECSMVLIATAREFGRQLHDELAELTGAVQRLGEALQESVEDAQQQLLKVYLCPSVCACVYVCVRRPACACT